MGNCSSRKSTPDYQVFVWTGDRKGAGTDANVCIALYNDRGERSRYIPLDCRFRDDFERGCMDRFPVTNLPDFGAVTSIELLRDDSGLNDDWYVDLVKVDCEALKKVFVFPVHRWIKANVRVVIKEFDTCLPQHDDRVEQRKAELQEKRQLYEYEQKMEGFMLQIKTLPKDESFSFAYQWDLLKMAVKMKLEEGFINFKPTPWETIEDINELYTGKLPKPQGTEKWRSDKHFGYQRLIGCNPAQIRLCKAIPDKFPVTDQILQPLLEGMTIVEAIDKKRLFMIDYEILRDLPCTDPAGICAPICLFFVNKEKNLLPVAIQLFQVPSEDNPIFLPTDQEYVWLMAKMWFNNADACFHQSASHLGFTHFFMETVAVSIHRSLSPSHPLFRLMAAHFLYLLAINTSGLTVLLEEGGWADEIMNMGRIGMLEIIRRTWSHWSLDVQGNLLNDLADRGVDDPEVLPNYHYRDDALLVRKAIHDYVKEIVDHHYDADEKVSGDPELQAWGKILGLGDDPLQHAAIKGIPNEGVFKTADDVTKVVTDIIFICSVQHATVNFPQYDEYAFPPNYPGFLAGPPPTNKNDLEEKDILAQLPSKESTVSGMVMTKILSQHTTNALGNFEVQYVYDPVGTKALKRFRSELVKIGKTIDKRNATREAKYTNLHPTQIPNAISI